MRLGDFLNVTAGIPETELRRAMVAALSVEPARTPDAFGRFYERVVRDLSLDLIAEIGNGLPARPPHGTAPAPQLTPAVPESDMTAKGCGG